MDTQDVGSTVDRVRTYWYGFQLYTGNPNDLGIDSNAQ